MEFVGLDPLKAGELAQHLDGAARDLEHNAVVVAQLFDQAGIHSSAAPKELRDIAAWAAYRSRDLERRIAEIVAADSGSAGATPRPGFRFLHRTDAGKAGNEAADKIRALLDGRHAKQLDAELARAKPYLADPGYAAGFFKGLGPKATFDLLSRVRGEDLLAVGRALAVAQKEQKLGKQFFDGILAAAKRQAAALYAYEHGAGGVDIRDRQEYSTQKYERGITAPPGAYDFLDTIAPVVPYIEAGAKVAVIGAAVVVVSLGAACVVGTDGACAAPVSAIDEQIFVAFSDEGAPVVVDLDVVSSEAFGGLEAEISAVERHLGSLPDDALGSPPNQAMLQRLVEANATGRPLTIAEENFLRHELVESELMRAGFSQDTAHLLAGLTHPTYANYDPEVIREFPDLFNNAWRAYWGIK